MANIALNKPSGGQLILSPEDGTSTETVTIPSVGVGKLLQIDYMENNTPVSGVQGTWVDTNVTLTITPSSTTSKIYVLANMMFYSNRHGGGFRILRDGSTAVHEDMVYSNYTDTGGSTNYRSVATVTGLDTPNTTSPVTYRIQVKQYYTTLFHVNESNGVSSLTLMEVAA